MLFALISNILAGLKDGMIDKIGVQRKGTSSVIIVTNERILSIRMNNFGHNKICLACFFTKCRCFYHISIRSGLIYSSSFEIKTTLSDLMIYIYYLTFKNIFLQPHT